MLRSREAPLGSKTHAPTVEAGTEVQPPAPEEGGWLGNSDLLSMMGEGLQSGGELLGEVLQAGADLSGDVLEQLTGGGDLAELVQIGMLPSVTPNVLESLERLMGPPDESLSVEATPGDAQDQAANDEDYAQKLEIALEIIELSGGGTDADAQLVAAELVKMPLAALQILQAKGTKVVVCRGSVTDHMEELRGVRPRGWPPGATWDSVPGLYNPGGNEVVIATVGHETEEGAHVPEAGEGHGAYSLVVHEVMHGVDAQAGELSETPEFIAARDADAEALAAHGYLSQAGEAGHEETFAEVAARYYSGDATLQAELPNLYAYFASNPLDSVQLEDE